MLNHTSMNRRQFLSHAATAATVALAAGQVRAQEKAVPFRLNYNLASSLYGKLPLAEVLAQVKPHGADTIDIWPAVHANQREQMDAMGHGAYRALLEKHGVTTGMFTRYDLGPYKLQDEMVVAKEFGAKIIIAGSGNTEGPDLKSRVATFLEKMKPHIAKAEENGVILGIENHANALINEPDSLRYFAELSTSDNIGIALAPYHLPQDPALIAQLIREIGPKLVHFYAWEHGEGSTHAMPKVLEMKQLPGYGTLDFKPIVDALRDIKYAGWTSVFMHPYPRGIPILPTAEESTAALNRSREYLDSLL